MDPGADQERRCIFCGDDGRLTREHVIAQWIIEVLNDMEPGDAAPDWGTHYWAGGTVERERQHAASAPTVVVRAVCADCNGHWMAAIEGRARPVLEAMIRGRRVSLDIHQQLDVAAWASKTIAALEFHEPSTVVTRQEDRDLIRRELRPPHHHRVRLAHRSEVGESLIAKMLVARSATAPDDRPDAFVTTLGIGFLVVQVWGGHGSDTGEGLTRTGTSASRAVMVWPPVMGTVSWPPAMPVEEEDLDAFTREVIIWADDSPDLAAWRSRRQLPDP